MRFRVSLVLMTTLLVSFGAFGQKRSITEKDLFDFTWIGDPQVAPDGSRVVFVRVGANDKRNGYNTSLWVVSTTTGDVHQLTNNTRDSAPRWSPDGKYLAFVRVTEKDGKPDQPQLFMMNMAGGESFQFTSLPKGVTQPAWSPDGKSIAFLSTTNPEDARRTDSETDHESDVRVITRAVYRSNDAGYLDPRRPMHLWVVQVPRNSDDKVSPKQLTTGRFSEGSIVWAKDGSQIYFTSVRIDEPYYELPVSTPTRIGDLFYLERSGAQPKRLASLNDAVFSNINLTEPEEVWYTSFDGKRIQAWLQKPPAFDAQKKYPLILDIHGGPHTAYGYVFDHEFQWMAAKGYVVLYPNPRGSTSYGQEFGNIIQYRYPGDDYKDLMAGVDEVIKRGYIDTNKLGVTGGSGGGLLTNWTIGQTTRFAAAVSQRDIANWADWWYSADFTLFQPNWFKAPPFEDPEDYKARSPITYIKNVKTPLMVILGESDYRTPPGAGGEEMFRALKFRKIPTVMVRFPNESHELSRSGQPWHRVERLEHIVGWFDHWLIGIPKPEYDAAPEH